MGAISSETSRGMPIVENLRTRAKPATKESRQKKELTKKTRDRLFKARKELQNKDGRGALRILAGSESEATETGEKSELSRHYQKLKEKVTIAQNELKATISPDQTYEAKAGNDVKLGLVELEARAANLTQDESLSTAQFIAESQQIILQSGAMISEYTSQLNSIFERTFDLTLQLSSIDRRINQIKNLPIGKRALATFEVSKLKSKKTLLEKERASVITQETDLEAKKTQLETTTKPINEKRQQLILEEIKNTLTEIRKEHAIFINEALQDEQLLTEIRDVYIETYIAPEINRLIKEKKQGKPRLDRAKKQDFLRALRASRNLDDIPEEQREILNQKMSSFLSYDGGFYDLKYEIEQNLTRSNEKLLLRKILNNQVANSFKDFEDSLFLENLGIKQNQVHQLAREVMESEEVDGNHRYINESKIKKLDLENVAGSTPLIKWLKSMEKSQSITAVYGDRLIEIDNLIYQILIDKSLQDSNGNYIDNLLLYPTPESLRNLVLLASADVRSYRTVHSNGTLTALAKRADWPQILDQAESKYPSLKKARPILDHFNLTEHYNHPDIREAVNDFTFEVYTKDDNPRLTAIASEALANSSMVDELVVRGLITETEAKYLKSAQEKTKQMWKDQELRQQHIMISDYDLRNEIQNVCRPLMNDHDIGLQGRNIKRLKNLSILCQEIINSNDLKIVNILSSDIAVELVSGCRLSEEKSILFVKAIAKLSDVGISSLDPLSDLILGEGIFQAETKGNHAIKLITRTMSKQIDEITSRISETNPSLQINDENWQSLLSAYIIIQTNNGGVNTMSFSEKAKESIMTLFLNEEVKNFCLNKLNHQWHDYLIDGTPGVIPLSLSMVPELISFCHGAGPLSQIESLGLMIKAVNQADIQPTTAERTKGEIFTGLRQIEDRFVREKWSNEDRSDFYNVSRDILNMSPSVYSDFLNLFQNLNQSEIHRFAKDLFPLYRTELALSEQIDKSTGKKSFTKERLIAIRTDVRSFTDSLKRIDDPFQTQKTILLEEIRSIFQEKFGITKIPEDFTSEEHSRSFANITMYLANIRDRNVGKENILGYYLALKINNRWDDFRKGVEIDPSEYLTSEKSEAIKSYLSNRQRLNPLTSEALGITQAELPEFYRLLQQESQNITIGNIETIDVKLNNIIINLRSLEDLDLYPAQLDKQRMKLLIDFGNKKIGSVVARMYQQLNNTTKSFEFSEEELIIKNQIEIIISENKLQLDAETIKKQFQDGLKPFATVVNLLSFVEDTQAEQEISDLRKLLQPKPEVIEVFNRLGEDFKSSSGALALSQDLNYLDNLIVKREDELKPGEKTLLTEYITSIRQQMIKLETIYNQVKNKFVVLEQGQLNTSNDQLKDKLVQISQIINTQSSQQTITSTITNDLNIIIENIRECLSCVREGGNNDTNLTFSDINKFYLYSQTEAGKKGSLSDEVVFIEPITHSDGTQEIAFVLDKVYGTNTPVILVNQINAVQKKYQIIKQKFPNVKLSILVSDQAISSSGLSADLLMEELKSENIFTGKENGIVVDVAESAFGDHYIELGGGVGARTSGKRTINGIIIK